MRKDKGVTYSHSLTQVKPRRNHTLLPVSLAARGSLCGSFNGPWQASCNADGTARSEGAPVEVGIFFRGFGAVDDLCGVCLVLNVESDKMMFKQDRELGSLWGGDLHS